MKAPITPWGPSCWHPKQAAAVAGKPPIFRCGKIIWLPNAGKMTTVIQLVSNPHTPNLPAWKVDSFFFSVGQAVRYVVLSSWLRGRKKKRTNPTPSEKKQKLLTIGLFTVIPRSCWLLTFISEVLTVGSLPRQKCTNQIQPPFPLRLRNDCMPIPSANQWHLQRTPVRG